LTPRRIMVCGSSDVFVDKVSCSTGFIHHEEHEGFG
jgi:hypothetical protein